MKLLSHLTMVSLVLISLISLSLFSLNGCHPTESSNSPQVQKLIQQNNADMVFVKGGTYRMGQVTYKGQTYSDVPHKVTLSSFYISKDNVSYAEYDAYTEAVGKRYIQNDMKQLKAYFRAPDYPVDNITWYQAHDYCAWLAQKTRLPYALPTEAQWEYVARNLGKPNWMYATDDGTAKPGVNYPSVQQFTSQPGNIGGDLSPLPVGSLPCTTMGICGLDGEVDQWMNDWFTKTFSSSPVTNPQGPATGKQKTVRGGDSTSDIEFNIVLGRYSRDPNDAFAGFRCVINTDQPLPK